MSFKRAKDFFNGVAENSTRRSMNRERVITNERRVTSERETMTPNGNAETRKQVVVTSKSSTVTSNGHTATPSSVPPFRRECSEETIEELMEKVSIMEEVTRNTDERLRSLETRVESLDVSVGRALSSLFPRVDALLANVEASASIRNEDVADGAPVNEENVDQPYGTKSFQRTTSSTSSISSAGELTSLERKVSSASGQTSMDGTVQTRRRLPESVSPEEAAQLAEKLRRATWEGDRELISATLYAGADVNVRDSRGRTSLHWAAAKPCHQAVDALLKGGASPSCTDASGRQPLHTASISGCAASVRLLINAGADVNTADVRGATPLHHAAANGHAAAVSALLAAGAKSTTTNSVGQTPIDVTYDATTLWLLRQHQEKETKMEKSFDDIEFSFKK